MLIAKDFVFIHMPKTGGSYVIKMITDILHKRVHIKKDSFGHRLLRKFDLDYNIIGYKLAYRSFPHQAVSKIPQKYQDKEVVSIRRNPFRKWLSEYNFNFWFNHPEYFKYFGAPLDEVRKVAPTFCTESQTFQDYVKALNHFLTNAKHDSNYPFGYLTTQFINFYCKHPGKLLSNYALTAEEIKNDMYDVTFFRTIKLYEDLVKFLKESLLFSRDVDKISNNLILPEGRGFKQEPNYLDYYSSDLLAEVGMKESLMLELFPDYKL